MRTVVVGNRELARDTLAYMLAEDWNVVGAVSAAGEGARKQAGYVSFADLADRYNVTTISTTDINDAETKSRLRDLNPDLCVCPGWHQIIDASVLDIPDRGFVGVHSSDLPRGRGGAPVNWAMINGEPEIAVSMFYYSPGVDAGDVIHKEYVPIEDRDDINTILDKIAVAIRDCLVETRAAFEADDIEATPQDIEDATYRPRRQPQDGVVDWSRPTEWLFDWVRAQTDPYPGAYTFFSGQKLTVWSAQPRFDTSADAPPGTVLGIVDGDGVDIATGDGVLRLGRVQSESTPRMWADEFANRRGVKAGDTLGRDHAPPSWRFTTVRAADGGTDFSAASNLSVGHRGEVLAVVESQGDRMVKVTGTLDGELVCDKRVACPGRENVPISYEPDTPGTHTLTVEFHEDKKRVDVRYLKVFVSA